MLNGFYRGIVFNNNDPQGLGRLSVLVPKLGSEWVKWAMPSVPYVGKSKGFYLIPENKSMVWIGFEEGDENKPIWFGGFWGTPTATGKYADEAGRETPQTDVNKKTIKTKTCTIEIDDTTGDVKITTAGNIVFNEGEKGVARLDDTIESTSENDIEFWTCISFIVSSLSSLGFVYPNITPTSLLGKIVSASSRIKAGD